MNPDIKLMAVGKVIFIQKLQNGYSINYACKFIEYKKGIVKGSIKDIKPEWALHKTSVGTVITARLGKCYVRDYRDMCCWFK